MCGLIGHCRGLGKTLRPVVKDTWSSKVMTEDILTAYAWFEGAFPSKRVLG